MAVSGLAVVAGRGRNDVPLGSSSVRRSRGLFVSLKLAVLRQCKTQELVHDVVPIVIRPLAHERQLSRYRLLDGRLQLDAIDSTDLPILNLLMTLTFDSDSVTQFGSSQISSRSNRSAVDQVWRRALQAKGGNDHCVTSTRQPEAGSLPPGSRHLLRPLHFASR